MANMWIALAMLKTFISNKLINVCKAASVTHTKRIYRNLLRKETSFVCYTSSVLRKSRHMKQKEKITHCCQDQNLKLLKLKITKIFYKNFKITKIEDCKNLAQLQLFH